MLGGRTSQRRSQWHLVGLVGGLSTGSRAPSRPPGPAPIIAMDGEGGTGNHAAFPFLLLDLPDATIDLDDDEADGEAARAPFELVCASGWFQEGCHGWCGGAEPAAYGQRGRGSVSHLVTQCGLELAPITVKRIPQVMCVHAVASTGLLSQVLPVPTWCISELSMPQLCFQQRAAVYSCSNWGCQESLAESTGIYGQG
eukprot:15485047-Alexandrium_andersonii.AAC.2